MDVYTIERTHPWDFLLIHIFFPYCFSKNYNQ